MRGRANQNTAKCVALLVLYLVGALFVLALAPSPASEPHPVIHMLASVVAVLGALHAAGSCRRYALFTAFGGLAASVVAYDYFMACRWWPMETTDLVIIARCAFWIGAMAGACRGAAMVRHRWDDRRRRRSRPVRWAEALCHPPDRGSDTDALENHV